jgi:hypothetical protein
VARLGWQAIGRHHERFNVFGQRRCSVFNLADCVEDERVIAGFGTAAQFALAAAGRIVEQLNAPRYASANASKLGQEFSHGRRQPRGHAASLALRRRQILVCVE